MGLPREDTKTDGGASSNPFFSESAKDSIPEESEIAPPVVIFSNPEVPEESSRFEESEISKTIDNDQKSEEDEKPVETEPETAVDAFEADAFDGDAFDEPPPPPPPAPKEEEEEEVKQEEAPEEKAESEKEKSEPEAQEEEEEKEPSEKAESVKEEPEAKAESEK